jgi:hypothetical protein
LEREFINYFILSSEINAESIDWRKLMFGKKL